MASSTVRQRCVVIGRCVLDGGQPFEVRVLELSERDAFLEETDGLLSAERGDEGTLTLPMPGGGPWECRVQLRRPARAQVDVARAGVDHLTVTSSGWRVSFVGLPRDDRARLRGYLELLDER